VSTAPHVDVDVAEFWRDPYPTLSQLRKAAPIAFVPQLGGILFTKRDDIFVCEKQIDVFSSYQPQGLMTKLMGENMMRKDGEAHMAERKIIFPAVSPKTVKTVWSGQFQAHADRIIDEIEPRKAVDLCKAFALRFSAECLKTITGLTNMRFSDMNDWSQGMIDGISNYTGDPAIQARCNAATDGIDAAIDDMLPVLSKNPDQSLIGVMLAAGLPIANLRANIKLAISGGQNEPRDAVTGTIWALLRHPDQLALARSGDASWLAAFEEYSRWISPIGMSPRRIAKSWKIRDIEFAPEDRIFFMFGSANRDEDHFDRPDDFDITRSTAKSIAFGAGPHFCAGAWASRSMVADIALPTVFRRLPDLRISEAEDVRIGGWAFRGLLNLPVTWN